MEKKLGKPRILVAPLDWGLGHATRCIPIIRELLAQGYEVWLAGEGAQEELLKTEFPDLSFLHLTGYRIKYAKTARGLIWQMIKQTSKLKRAIKAENQWLKKVSDEYHFDAVISDNRFGLYHSSIPCIIITHQLLIKSPFGKWTEKILQKRNYNYINRFSECWVPDLPAGQTGIESEENLAADLSHPDIKPKIPVRYIGWLSRFSKQELTVKNKHLLIILSGPEPQRSMLEEIAIEETSRYTGTATIVRGLPGSSALIPSSGMIKFYNHLATEELNKEMQQAEFVISRSGYSTVMDLMVLQKQSILIPTPGQTEQEYLAKILFEKNISCTVTQKNFNLNRALQKAKAFPYQLTGQPANSLLSQIISNFISSIKGE
ncbi:MAG: glycosyltransferase [Chitinophagaceae bacterium]